MNHARKNNNNTTTPCLFLFFFFTVKYDGLKIRQQTQAKLFCLILFTAQRHQRVEQHQEARTKMGHDFE